MTDPTSSSSSTPARAEQATRDDSRPTLQGGAGATGQAPAPASRVVASLLGDHLWVEGLFQRFEATAAHETQRRHELVQSMIRALGVHALIEEEVVYPVMASALPDGQREWTEALEEQQRQKELLARLERMRPTDPAYEDTVRRLIEETRAHVLEEETDLFPRLEEAVSPAQLTAMAVALETARLLAPTHPHPRAPNRPPFNVLAGLSVAPLDWSRDLVGALLAAGRSANRR